MKKIAIAAVFAAVLSAGTYVYAQSDNMAGMDHSGMNMGNRRHDDDEPCGHDPAGTGR